MQNAQPSVGGAALVMSLAVAFRAVLDDAGREAGAPALVLATGAQYGWDYAAFRSRGRLDDEPEVIVVIAKATRRQGARVVPVEVPDAAGMRLTVQPRFHQGGVAHHGMIYVNVHSVAKPGGVARGQLEED